MAYRQRLTALATTDGEGNTEFIFNGPNLSGTYVGTLTVPGAPASAVFTVTIDPVTEGTFYGTNPGGTVQLDTGQQMVVTASGLIPTTEYQMVFICQQVPQGSVVTSWTPTGGILSGTIAGTVVADQGAPNTEPNAWPVYLADLPIDVNVLSIPPPTLPTVPFVDFLEMDGSADRLPNSGTLINGAILEAYSQNTASIWVGASDLVTVGPGGGGFEIVPGSSQPAGVRNTDAYWAIGSPGDYLLINAS